MNHEHAHIDELAMLELQAYVDIWADDRPELVVKMLENFLATVHVVPVYGEKLDADSNPDACR